MKILYYSLTGNTKQAAEYLAELLGAGLEELEPKKPYPKNAFFQMILGGYEVAAKKERELSMLPEVDEGLILLGTPVWNSGPAPVLRTFLRSKSLKGKRAAAFATSLSGSAQKCLDALETLAGEPLCARLSLRVKRGGLTENNRQELEAFAERLLREKLHRPERGGM